MMFWAETNSPKQGVGPKIDAVMVVVHYVVGNQRGGLVWVVIWVPGACASK